MSSVEWETPQDLFEAIDSEFHFTLDACASPENAKCERYYTKQHDTLDRDWSSEVVWMNPPYDSGIELWLRKAYKEAQKDTTVVCLIQSRSTETDLWHEWVMRASELRYIRGRLSFKRADGFCGRANIANVVVVFLPFCQGPPVVSSIDTKGKWL